MSVPSVMDMFRNLGFAIIARGSTEVHAPKNRQFFYRQNCEIKFTNQDLIKVEFFAGACNVYLVISSGATSSSSDKKEKKSNRIASGIKLISDFATIATGKKMMGMHETSTVESVKEAFIKSGMPGKYAAKSSKAVYGEVKKTGFKTAGLIATTFGVSMVLGDAIYTMNSNYPVNDENETENKFALGLIIFTFLLPITVWFHRCYKEEARQKDEIAETRVDQSNNLNLPDSGLE